MYGISNTTYAIQLVIGSTAEHRYNNTLACTDVPIFNILYICVRCTARDRRKEMEMLSDQKRGWQGRSGGVMPPAAKSGSNGRRKGSSTKTRNRGTAVAAIGGSGKKGSLRSPQCHSQFQRDWRRRCHTDGERQAYLRLVGPENLAVIFRVEMEPDTLGQVLSLICAGFAEETQTKDPNAVSSFAPADPTDSVDSGGESWQASREKAAIYCVDWLRALTRTGRFEINIQFLESKEKRVLARVFDLIAEVFGDGSGAQDPERLDSLRKMYAV